jgi:hypothetical protein
MKYDCGFSKGKNRFRYSAGGIIVNNGKMLFVKSGIGDYYYMIGGAVHMGEKLVWLPIEEIRTSQIKPTFIKERISEILNSSNIIHIFEERDR